MFWAIVLQNAYAEYSLSIFSKPSSVACEYPSLKASDWPVVVDPPNSPHPESNKQVTAEIADLTKSFIIYKVISSSRISRAF